MTYQKMIVFPLFLSFFRALTALASHVFLNHFSLRLKIVRSGNFCAECSSKDLR